VYGFKFFCVKREGKRGRGKRGIGEERREGGRERESYFF
jgi:hypothetical protein